VSAAPGLLLYGAYGYTGELIAREAVRRGLEPILAGRDAAAVGALARELALPARCCALDQPAALRTGLEGVAVVVHAAGPFVRTSRPMVDACLAAGAHYLDITGEIDVYEAIYRRHEAALRSGVGLVPGVGFDVVPSDALAARLAAALPDAAELDLAFTTDRGSASRGTLVTMLERLPAAGCVRRDGKLVPVPLAFATMEVDFPGLGRRSVMTIPWGDLAAAWRTTGIPNLRTFVGASPRTIRRLRRLRPLLPLVGWNPLRRLLQALVRRKVTGPDEATRRSARAFLWGRARTLDGRVATGALSVPEGYAFTAAAAVEAARRALAGELAPGAWTPTRAFGPRLVDAIPEVRWGEVAIAAAPSPVIAREPR
jgi:short subunit dehydrogenase-like uncharacterized protein